MKVERKRLFYFATGIWRGEDISKVSPSFIWKKYGRNYC